MVLDEVGGGAAADGGIDDGAGGDAPLPGGRVYPLRAPLLGLVLPLPLAVDLPHWSVGPGW